MSDRVIEDSSTILGTEIAPIDNRLGTEKIEITRTIKLKPAASPGGHRHDSGRHGLNYR
ncbi:MAG: hypothetical protein HQL35_12770 [Alphaproteobacteria bacterium]|nr:hypothetical protein [Alphaproteobacteria bacterium]